MDTRLLPSWQARHEAAIEEKFNALVGTQPEQATPPATPKAPDVDPRVADGWMGEFLRTTGADVADVLLRGASFNLIKPSDFGALGKIVDTYKTPEDRKTALRKWAEFLMIELPVGMLSPLGKLVAPIGRLAQGSVKGAGAVVQGAVRGAAEMGSIGAAQQAGEEVRSALEPVGLTDLVTESEAYKKRHEGLLPKVGRVAAAGVAGATIGAAFGGGLVVGEKIVNVIARRFAKKVDTVGSKAADDAEAKAWDDYAAARPGETTATATAEMDAAEKAAWDTFAAQAEKEGRTPTIEEFRKALPAGVEPKALPAAKEPKMIGTGRVIEGQPSSAIREGQPPRRPIAALPPAPEPPPPPPQLTAREIVKRADILEAQKEGLGESGRRILDERIAELRAQARERAAVEVAEQAATGMKDPEIRKAVQSALDEGRLFLPEGMGRDLGPSGRINVAFTSMLARAAVGAITGYATGETDEERVQNALILAGAGAILSPRLLKSVVGKMTAGVTEASKTFGTMTVKQGRRLFSIRNLTQADAERMGQLDPAEIKIPNNRGLSIKYGEVGTGDDVESLIKRVYSEFGEAGSGAVHMTDEQLWKAAQSIGAEQVLARKPGEPVNRQQLAGAVALFTSLKGEMQNLLQQAAAGVDLTPDMLRRLSIGASIANTIQGSLNEAGATLRIGRLSAQLASAGQLHTLDEIARAFGGPNALTFDGPIPASAIQDMIRQAANKNKLPGWFANLHKDLIGSWINGMLSSGVSFMRNLVGTGVMVPFKVAERRLAEIGGHVAPGEASEIIWATQETFRDALRIAINSWEARPGMTAVKAGLGAGIGLTQGDTWDERLQNAATLGAIGAFSQVRFPEWGVTKLEGTGARRLWNPDNYGVDPATFFGKGMLLLGDLMQTPGDALRQADNLLKMVNYRWETRALARREVWGDAALRSDPAKFDAALAEKINNPSQETMQAARLAAEKNTFTRDLGQFGSLLANTIDSNILSKIIVPFFRTTVNIGKEFLEMAPGVAQLHRANWQAMQKGGADRDLAIAKQALGLIIALPALYLADRGNLLGDMPKNQATASIANNLGVQPYAVKFDSGKTISFNGMAPMGWFFGMAADITQMLKHADDTTAPLVIDFAKAYILALGKNVASQSYLQSVGNAVQALLDEDGNKLTRYLQMEAQSLVPRFAGNWAAQDDQVRYEIHTIRDAVYSQIPGYSRSVPPLRDPFGDIVYRYGAVGPDSASFLFVRPGTKDPAKQAILDNGITLTKPPRALYGVAEPSTWFPSTNPLKYGVPLSAEQYDRYVELSGNAAKDRNGKGFKDKVTEYVTSTRYATDSRAGREERILSLAREYRTLAQERLLQEYPELRIKARQLEQARAEAMRPGANEAEILQRLRAQ